MKIAYSSQSKFLAPCQQALSRGRAHLSSGVEVTLEDGGDDARMWVTIDAGDAAHFEARWKGMDVSHFPARIKAAATALSRLGLVGVFEICHHNGMLSIRQKGNHEEEGWSREELKAAVETYMEMLDAHQAGRKIVKTHYYDALAQRFGRSPKAFEFRLQNISAIYVEMGREWLPGLKPAPHIGRQVAAVLEALIAEVEGQSGNSHLLLVGRLKTSTKQQPRKPRGVKHPPSSVVTVTQFCRDDAVREWVLFQADGHCECCAQPAPFVQADGTPFLEVHHVHPLGKGGSDTPENTVALCPNCHRELHYGVRASALVTALYERVPRLVQEYPVYPHKGEMLGRSSRTA